MLNPSKKIRDNAFLSFLRVLISANGDGERQCIYVPSTRVYLALLFSPRYYLVSAIEMSVEAEKIIDLYNEVTVTS